MNYVCEICLMGVDRQAWWTDGLSRATLCDCEICGREDVCAPLGLQKFQDVCERLAWQATDGKHEGARE